MQSKDTTGEINTKSEATGKPEIDLNVLLEDIENEFAEIDDLLKDVGETNDF
jgi:hypothetical protein|tara:strand:+ start:16 stop:171 length:156 start_codon:yes stop_codon:yes gene_type:complete